MAFIVATTVALVACGGATPPTSPGSAAPSSAAGSASPPAASTASSSPTASRSAAPTPGDSTLDVISFDIDGSIGGRTVSGKLAHGAFTVPCAGAGATDVVTVHWRGDVAPTSLQGEIDFKPGTWSLGSSSAQGVATVGLLGGKPADDLIASAGTVTTAASGGSIDGTFTNGGDSLHVSGTWRCPN